MSNLLVLGYGNPLCGDDGVAWRVIEALEGLLPNASTVAVHQLTPEWADTVSKMDFVVFVDAAVGEVPGEVRCLPLTPVAGRPDSHEMTPEGILAMAADLFGRCPPAQLVVITGGSFEISDQVTAPVNEAVPEAVTRILVLIRHISDA